MKSIRKSAALLLLLCCVVRLNAQDMDKEVSALAEKLAAPIKENAKKKVAVIDFTDLQGASSELGKYIAEQLTVDLVMIKRDFAVLDRANLKSILAEHKLTATGLVDPENAKKLGMFAGVDALILGTLTPKSQKISVTAKIITTDTAEIVGAAKTEFALDETAKELAGHPTVDASSQQATASKESPKLTKTFGSLVVELNSLRIINNDQYLLTLSLTNKNPKQPIYVSLNADWSRRQLPSVFTDPEGYEFHADKGDVVGVEVGGMDKYMGYQGRVTKIAVAETVSATIKFYSEPARLPTPGRCRVQLAIFGADVDGYGRVQGGRVLNFLTDITAN